MAFENSLVGISAITGWVCRVSEFIHASKFLMAHLCSSLDEVPPDIKKAPEEVTNVPFGRFISSNNKEILLDVNNDSTFSNQY